MADRDENQQPPAYLADQRTIYRNACFAHALDQGSHDIEDLTQV
jgi:hypothetical protein